MEPSRLDDFADTLAREKAVKSTIIMLVFLALAYFRQEAHPYLAIALFALLADLFALNRLRRFVDIVRAANADANAAAERREDDSE